MTVMTVEHLYEQHIKPLSVQQRLRLVALITDKLAREATPASTGESKRSIMELHGLGKEIREGIDAQEYVNELREEWDHRPL